MKRECMYCHGTIPWQEGDGDPAGPVSHGCCQKDHWRLLMDFDEDFKACILRLRELAAENGATPEDIAAAIRGDKIEPSAAVDVAPTNW